MKFAIIRSSELGNRWDAGFHLARTEYKEKTDELALSLSADEAFELISDEDAFPLEVLHCLSPLCRGSNPPTKKDYLKAAREYPHLALAILSEGAENALKAQQEALEKKIEAIKKVSQKLKDAKERAQIIIEAAKKKPEVDQNLFQPLTDELKKLIKNNKFVSGVIYQDGEELIIPVHTNNTMYIADCWVVELENWSGIKTIQTLIDQGDVPVPRRYQDLGNAIGFVELPGHEHNYNKGWRV
jgi:hypothetical protein